MRSTALSLPPQLVFPALVNCASFPSLKMLLWVGKMSIRRNVTLTK